MNVESPRAWPSPIVSSHQRSPAPAHEPQNKPPSPLPILPQTTMSTETLPRAQFPPQPVFSAAAGPLPQGIPTEGPATHPEGPPRDYTYPVSSHPIQFAPPPSSSNTSTPPNMPHMPDAQQPTKQDTYYVNASDLYGRTKQSSSSPPPGSEASREGGAGANHYPSSSGVPRLPPILQVEKQQVTTSATQLASASRRRNEAHFVCPVPGCGSTFTRRFNLRGHLRSHTEERPYVCEWPGCKKGFARQHDCKRHQALHAAKSQSNICQGCKKTFSRLDALNRHLRSDGGAECRASTQKFMEEDENRNDQSVSSSLPVQLP